MIKIVQELLKCVSLHILDMNTKMSSKWRQKCKKFLQKRDGSLKRPSKLH